MPTLTPSDAELGPVSPVLGPWFWPNPSAFQALPAPSDDLSVEIDLGPNQSWLPPAAGIQSLHVRTVDPPTALAAFRGVDGSEAPFAEGALVCVHTLLPEVSARLDAMLTALLGQADGVARPGARARARVSAFTMEWSQDGVEPNASRWNVDPSFDLPAADPATHAGRLGLAIAEGLDTVISGIRPMTQLRRPGKSGDIPTALIHAKKSLTVKLRAFDHRGRPVDVGAVADWWAALAADFGTTLWQPDFGTNEQVTVSVESARTAQLVNLHQAAPLDATRAALRVDGSAVAGALVEATGAAELTMDLPADSPPRRLGLMPNGTLGTSLSLWPGSATHPERDFVRVALADPEVHLFGRERSSDEETQALITTTGPQVHRSPTPVLLSDAEAASAAIIDVLDGVGDRTLITGVLDRDFGAVPARAADPDPSSITFPDRITVTAQPIVGGGPAPSEGLVQAHLILLTIDVGPALSGTWVRAWPQGFDSGKARHVRLDGGAAPLGGTGQARLVLQLPEGGADPGAHMSVDVMVIAGPRASRHYAGSRFARPIPVGGDPIAVTEVGSDLVLVCERSPDAVAPAAIANVPAGATLLALTSPNPTLIDSATVPAGAYPSETTLPAHLPGLTIALTAPAFEHTPSGASAAALQAQGAVVDRATRSTLLDIGLRSAGEPLPLQERLEVVATRLDSGTPAAEAAIGGVPTLSRYHELLPHQLGHPGAPGAVDVHGTGVRLAGIAAVPALEIARDRTVTGTMDLVKAAASPIPVVAEAANASVWTSVLQTVAAGTEGEVLLTAADFPFADQLGAGLLFLQNLLEPAGAPVPIPPAGTAAARSLARAAFRRARLCKFGAREGWDSLRSAIARAQDFVYIETPWIDDRSYAGAPDLLFDEPSAKPVWTALQERLDAQKSLKVVLCLPSYLMPAAPKALTLARNHFLPASSDRVVVFSPSAGPGRSLRIATTSVIVDDVYALTGTTHLSRRGVTYDSSIAVAVVGEQLEDGRSREVREFRRSLIAGRLGISTDLLPDDSSVLFESLFRAVKAQSRRFTRAGFDRPDPEEAEDLVHDALNPDGSPGDMFDVDERVAAALLAVLEVNLEDPPPPEP